MSRFTVFPSQPIVTIDAAPDACALVSGRAHMQPLPQQERTYAAESQSRLAYGGTSLTNLSGVNDLRTGHYKRQLGTRLTYYNYTEGPIVVYERSGIPMLLNPDTRRSGYGEPCVVIRKEILFDDKEVAERTLKAIRSLGDIASADMRQVRNHLAAELRLIGIYGYRLELEYAITARDLQKNGGAVYHHKTDVVVSILDLRETPKHPGSSEVVNLGALRSIVPNLEDDVNVVVRYIDQDPHARPLYLCVAGKVLELIPQQAYPTKLLEVASKNKRPDATDVEAGAYVEFIHTAKVDGGARGEIVYSRVSVDEAKASYGLFESRGDAINSKASMEATIRQQKQIIDGQEAAFKDRLADAQRVQRDQLLALQDKLREREQQLEAKAVEIQDMRRNRAAEAEEIKERREGQVHKQKMTFETVKFVISIATLLLGMIPLILKLKQKPTA